MSYDLLITQECFPPAQEACSPQVHPPKHQEGDPGPPPYTPNNQAPTTAVTVRQTQAPTTAVIVRQTQGVPPSDYMVLAILTTIFCCLPFGIVAIVQASNVRSRWATGDVDGALEASRSAKCWGIAALVTGTGSIVVIPIIYVVVIGAAAAAVVANEENMENNY